MRTAIGIAVHALIFLVAVVIFCYALGVGLATSPTQGMSLWIVGAVVAVGDVMWMALKPLWQRT